MIDRIPLLQLEEYIVAIDVVAYSEQRNYLNGSTRLSEYITRGFISLPRVRALLLIRNSEQKAYKLLNELSWREYWQHTWRIRGAGIFEYFRPPDHAPRQGLPAAVLNATTGITALDDGIQQLYRVGYIHNHMRLWIAGLVCNIAKCDWKIGATWMHSYLLDGDYASNYLSWQWVAGSYTGSSYLPQQANINTYTRTLQTGTYLDYPYAYISKMPIPEQLVSLAENLLRHDSQPMATTITIDEINAAETLLLYSPWTLDPKWRPSERGLRVLIMPAEIFVEGHFSQNVMDSIIYFSASITGLKTIYLNHEERGALQVKTVFRKDYPGINDWPGVVDLPELLYPDILQKFYPSFSSYWKQITKLHTSYDKF